MDPLTQAMIELRLRREAGLMKQQLIGRGIDPLTAERQALRHVRDYVAPEVMRSGYGLPPAAKVGPADRQLQMFRQDLADASVERARRQGALRVEAAKRYAYEPPPRPFSDMKQVDAAGMLKAQDPALVEMVSVQDAGVLPAGSEPPVAAPEVVAEQSPMEAPVALQDPAGLEMPGVMLEGSKPGPWREGYTFPNDSAVTPQPKKEAPPDSGMTWGAALAVLGTTQQVIGQFYALKSQQTQLKQQAMSLEFQGKMSQINARAAERQAADIIAAGRQQAMEATMRAGQVREAARATMGARGIRADVGSGAETMASIELMKEIDRFTIDANAVRAANAARMQGVNAANEGLLAETSAGSLRMQARALNPVAGAMPSLLTGAGQYLSQRAADRRWAAWASSQGLSE
jgi:hypothetical protein